MSKESLEKLLYTLSKYNNSQVSHTFGPKDRPQITVKFVRGTFEITYHDSQSNKVFYNLEEATESIYIIINTNITA